MADRSRRAFLRQMATVLAFLGFYTPANVSGAQSLHWRTGGRSIFRCFLIAPMSAVAAAVDAADETVTQNVAEQGGIWKPDVIRAFHEAPWLDAAGRLR